jgi:6-phosphogluconolactonase
MDDSVTVKVFDDGSALATAAAQTIASIADEAVASRGRFTVALSGGGTPRETYMRLAQPPYGDTMPWHRTFVFFSDERCVPHDHPDSNYRMARETLLGKVPIPADQIFPIRCDDGAESDAAAADYARALSDVFGLRRGELPRFDLILLGVGIDGHTGSLFPGSPALKEVFRPVVAVHAAAAAIPERITLTYPVLNSAANVIFLAAGAEKAKVVRSALKEGALLPAGMVRPANGRLVWLLDRAAAALVGA